MHTLVPVPFWDVHTNSEETFHTNSEETRAANNASPAPTLSLSLFVVVAKVLYPEFSSKKNNF
jgi:hypothetical protein